MLGSLLFTQVFWSWHTSDWTVSSLKFFIVQLKIVVRVWESAFQCSLRAVFILKTIKDFFFHLNFLVGTNTCFLNTLIQRHWICIIQRPWGAWQPCGTWITRVSPTVSSFLHLLLLTKLEILLERWANLQGPFSTETRSACQSFSIHDCLSAFRRLIAEIVCLEKARTLLSLYWENIH